MTVQRHAALNEPGETHLGEELDCPKCRAALLVSFSEPGAPPLPAATPVPHLIVPPGTAPTRPMSPQPEPHTTWHRVDPFKDGPGGTWAAGCSCGWSESGAYARDGKGELTAERLARTWAQKHRDNPLPPPDEDPA